MTRLKHLSPLPGPTTTETAALSDEQYYTIQPTPNGMPRSVRELREGIGLLSNDQLRQLVVAEAKRNNAFAGEVFENCDQEIFMRLNTIFDFDHFTERLEADIVVCQMSHSEDEQRLDAQKLVEQVDEMLKTMLEKAEQQHTSPGTKRSALCNMCKIGNVVAAAEPGVVSQRLKDNFANSRGGGLVKCMIQVLACMGAQELDEMATVTLGEAGTFLEQVEQLAKLSRDTSMFVGLDEMVDLLTRSDSSSEEDCESDAEMEEARPATPNVGDGKSVLIMMGRKKFWLS